MLHKVWITGLLISALRIGTAAAAMPQDTIGRSAPSKHKNEETNQATRKAKETTSQTT